MQQVFAITNGKGGSGKSPTALHLFFTLRRIWAKLYPRKPLPKFLFIDADPQATSSLHFLGQKHKTQKPTLYEAITEMQRVEPICIAEGLYLLSAHDELSRAEDELTRNPARPFQYVLKKLLRLYQDFDVVVIDTPGSHISIFTIMALVAAQKVIVPVKTELAHQQATIDTMSLIEDVRGDDTMLPEERLNADLVVWGLLPNQYELRNRHHAESLELIQEMKDPSGKPYPVYLPPSLKRTRYNDATGLHVPVYELAGSEDLARFWEEFTEAVLTQEVAA